MRPEDWLRERGIEVQRGIPGGQGGQLAGEATAALPIVEPNHIPFDHIPTQRMPVVIDGTAAPIAAADIAALPTGALSAGPPQAAMQEAIAEADATELATAHLPAAAPLDISHVPTRRL